jgi:hypothetical protein
MFQHSHGNFPSSEGLFSRGKLRLAQFLLQCAPAERSDITLISFLPLRTLWVQWGNSAPVEDPVFACNSPITTVSDAHIPSRKNVSFSASVYRSGVSKRKESQTKDALFNVWHSGIHIFSYNNRSATSLCNILKALIRHYLRMQTSKKYFLFSNFFVLQRQVQCKYTLHIKE